MIIITIPCSKVLLSCQVMSCSSSKRSVSDELGFTVFIGQVALKLLKRHLGFGGRLPARKNCFVLPSIGSLRRHASLFSILEILTCALLQDATASYLSS